MYICRGITVGSGKGLFLLVFMEGFIFNNPTNGGTVDLTQTNVDMTIASNELVFLIFYTEQCSNSNILMPIFDEAAEKVKQEFPDAGKAVMGKVYCDEETDISSRFHITKYPTLKIFRNGEHTKRMYTGQMSVEALVEFIKKQLEDPIEEFHNLNELSVLESNKNMFIGYFDRRDQPEYSIFRRVATNFKEDCQFHVGFGEAFKQMHLADHPIIVFRPNKDRSNDLDVTYNGSMNNFDEMHIWISEMCIPLVKEITFENAKELEMEGLPFLILFHTPDDKESIKRYTEIVQSDLISEKQSINFLTADGTRFTHPLQYLGKTEQDLPVIAIDSISSHIYLFPNYKDIENPGKLKEFIKDLYSGKLHRKFHNKLDQTNDIPQTTSPESTFKKLAPSKISTKHT